MKDDFDKRVESLEARVTLLHAEKARAYAKFMSAHRWIETYVWIRPEGGEPCKFSLNRAQRKFLNWLVKKLNRREPVRAIILKARRLGFSTLLEAWWLYLGHRYQGMRFCTIAADKDASQEIFQIASDMWRDMDPAVRRPLTRQEPAKAHFKFASPNDSEYRVISAGGRALHGPRNNGIQEDESAHYLFPKRVAQGVKQTLARPVYTWKSWHIRLSTANGLNHFYRAWQRAQNRDSRFVPFFFSWIDEPKLVMEVPGNFELSDEEAKYTEDVHRHTGRWLTDGQLMWARVTREDQCEDDWELWCEQYPAYPEQAFLSGAKSIFKQDLIGQQLRLVTSLDGNRPEIGPVFQGDIVYVPRANPPWKFIASKHGPLRIYEYPVPGEQYGVGMDTGQGVGSDYHCGKILKATNCFECAIYRCNDISAHDYSVKMMLLCRFYNLGLTAIERNQLGQIPIEVFTHLNINLSRYPGLQAYPVGRLYESTVYDRRLRAEKEVIGWSASKTSKITAVTTFATEFNDGGMTINSPDTLLQMQGYREAQKEDKQGHRSKGPPYAQTHQDPVSRLYNDDNIAATYLAVIAVREIRKGALSGWTSGSVNYVEV